ncbi:MAG TPA: TlpA disulfide reductase family protein [Chryseosolibacter sp.]|nr:TlpA disulfide reductase family protein [Chryseosolibacter sp.]
MRVIIILLLLVPVKLSAQGCFEKCNENLKKADFAFGAGQQIVEGLSGCSSPDFDLTTLTGERFKLSQLKGKVVVLNFWHTTCAPCVAGMPALNKLVSEYKGKNVVFIALAQDNPETIMLFLDKRPFSYKIVPSTNYLNDRFCLINGWPMNMVIDQAGIVQQIFTGGYVDHRAENEAYDLMKPTIEKLLAAKK